MTVPRVFDIVLVFFSIKETFVTLKMCWISILPFQQMDGYSCH